MHLTSSASTEPSSCARTHSHTATNRASAITAAQVVPRVQRTLSHDHYTYSGVVKRDGTRCQAVRSLHHLGERRFHRDHRVRRLARLAHAALNGRSPRSWVHRKCRHRGECSVRTYTQETSTDP